MRARLYNRFYKSSIRVLVEGLPYFLFLKVPLIYTSSISPPFYGIRLPRFKGGLSLVFGDGYFEKNGQCFTCYSQSLPYDLLRVTLQCAREEIFYEMQNYLYKSYSFFANHFYPIYIRDRICVFLILSNN